MTDGSRRKGREPLLIGFAERVDLPEWGINRIRAKIDTGARTSALHVDGIKRMPNGKVRFDVVVNRKTGRTRHVITDLERVGQVRSSSGSQETRYFVRTTLRLGDVEKEIEISLARRHAMQFRMLLGRTGLGHDFLIDAARRYVADHRHHPLGEPSHGGRADATGARKKPKKKAAKKTGDGSSDKSRKKKGRTSRGRGGKTREGRSP